ncbi:hypothetical protein EHW64_13695 [Erwinia psidii]|uniref:hypothetical protein n=1 Tax=Erwinia psidii TaxID=69224 RepID=UPI00226B5154|nr:hypothetical protein [Erwinia psidii]MCX8962156.1 hypothetical protein [Erwinia psidii]
MTNYTALGEFTGYSRQAKDAASKRFSLLHTLACELQHLSVDPLTPFEGASYQAAITAIGRADAEMRAAIKRANEAAALCGENPLTLSSLNTR